MVGSDGAVQVSKPAMAAVGPGGDAEGAGAGLSARTGRVGFGPGVVLGAGVCGAVGCGAVGGVNQAAAIPVGGGGSFGQAGFFASMTGGRTARIESPVRADRLVTGRTVASVCSTRFGSVP